MIYMCAGQHTPYYSGVQLASSLARSPWSVFHSLIVLVLFLIFILCCYLFFISCSFLFYFVVKSLPIQQKRLQHISPGLMISRPFCYFCGHNPAAPLTTTILQNGYFLNSLTRNQSILCPVSVRNAPRHVQSRQRITMPVLNGSRTSRVYRVRFGITNSTIVSTSV
jgi:uncharacterized integral membrane protein